MGVKKTLGGDRLRSGRKATQKIFIGSYCGQFGCYSVQWQFGSLIIKKNSQPKKEK